MTREEAVAFADKVVSQMAANQIDDAAQTFLESIRAAGDEWFKVHAITTLLADAVHDEKTSPESFANLSKTLSHRKEYIQFLELVCADHERLGYNKKKPGFQDPRLAQFLKGD